MSIPSSFIIGPFTIIFKLTELNVIVSERKCKDNIRDNIIVKYNIITYEVNLITF